MRFRVRLTGAAIVTALALSSCASLNIDAMPLPGSDYHDGYDMTIEFANVLNLPERAKVVMDGTKIGIVTKMTLAHNGVDVTTRIERGVVVPSNIHAVLQQATVLGDTYVALERVQDGDPGVAALGSGGRIPVAHTVSPPQLEDTIANMANFIGSGVIQKAQTTIIGINRVTPPRADVREIASRVAVDLSDLSSNMDNLDLSLTGLSEASNIMAANAQNFKFWLSPLGVEGFHHNFIVTHFLAPLLPTLGTVYFNGYWLVPVLEAAGSALESVQHSKWAFDEELPRFQKMVTENLLPERKYPAINITSIIGPDGRELSGNVRQVLQMIGAMP